MANFIPVKNKHIKTATLQHVRSDYFDGPIPQFSGETDQCYTTGHDVLFFALLVSVTWFSFEVIIIASYWMSAFACLYLKFHELMQNKLPLMEISWG